MAVSAPNGRTSHALMPFGVASRDVCGEKTDMPRAERERRERWMGSERVKDLRPRNICSLVAVHCWSDEEDTAVSGVVNLRQSRRPYGIRFFLG